MDLKNTINQLDLIDTYIIAKYTFLSAHKTFTKRDHILHNETSLDMF